MQHYVRDASKETYTKSDAIDMTSVLAAAALTASQLTLSLERLQKQQKEHEEQESMFDNHNNNDTTTTTTTNNSVVGQNQQQQQNAFLRVDPEMFTTRGIKKKNDAVIALLYQVGLPFLSSSDGRRFATQLELSNHLDALFKKRCEIILFCVGKKKEKKTLSTLKFSLCF